VLGHVHKNTLYRKNEKKEARIQWTTHRGAKRSAVEEVSEAVKKRQV